MKKALILIAVAFPFVFTNSCKHDAIIPDHPVYFVNDIKPIIYANCMHSGCHDDNNNADAHIMNTYNDVMAHEYVVPGKPKSSKMYNSVTGSGEEKMPRGNYPALTERQIKLLYIWIAQGAKNDSIL